MNLRPTLTMQREPILTQKNRCSIMQTTWMTNHVIVRFLQTGVVSQQITQKETTIFLEIVVSIKVAPCLSDQMIQQNAMIMSSTEDPVNVKPQHRWEIQGEWKEHFRSAMFVLKALTMLGIELTTAQEIVSIWLEMSILKCAIQQMTHAKPLCLLFVVNF